jgi:hypothetical protein
MNNPGGPPQGYPPPGGGYPPQAPGHPPPPGFPPQQGGYPPQQGGFPPQQGGFPPQQGGFPPQNAGYPPPQGYPPQHGAHPPHQPGFPPPPGYPPQGNWGAPANEPITAERAHLLRTFVGQNHDYYLNKWHEMDAKRSQSSFNVASFFLSAFWLIYRKMYAFGFGLLGGYLLLALVSSLSSNVAISSLISLLTLGAALYIGFMGNGFYRKHAEAAVARSATYPDPNARMHMLHQQGGTHIGAALGALGGYMVIVFLVVFISMR